MQRRIKAQPLVDRYGSSYPAPAQRVIDMSVLDGGLNLWELDYKLNKNQSPDLLNVYWKDGSLSSRPGQEWVFNQDEHTTHYGEFNACYEREWGEVPRLIVHKSNKLYAVNYDTGEHYEIYDGLSEVPGHFFVFGEKLYYFIPDIQLGAGSFRYIEITADFTVTEVAPYVPIVVMNRKPDGAGGDLYQPENRISAGKKVWFTADGTSVNYVLPYKELDSDEVSATVNGVDLTEGVDFTVNRTEGIITFTTAPTQTDPIVANNVKVTCYKLDEAARGSITTCRCIATYGTSDALAVVCGGPVAQPNAYFWSGNHDFLDPGYFPFDYYNLAGSADEAVTAFGKQQSMLIIFKERSIGKSTISTQSIDNREYVNLAYVPINDRIGCDVPESIQLVQNNLVFANRASGVYALLDTSAAGENNVKRLSRNVNGNADKVSRTIGMFEDKVSPIRVSSNGLLDDLRRAMYISSYDDNYRYWLVAVVPTEAGSLEGHAYLWDYTIRSVGAKEENLSWFYFENINALGWFHSIYAEYSDIHYDDPSDTRSKLGMFYFTANGSISTFSRAFSDYGDIIPRKYAFAVQSFGTYEVLKDVLKVIIAARSDTDSELLLTYRTDYEVRDDKTPIRAWSWRLSPRNLSHRSLRPVPFAGTAVRVPRCFHVRHFQMIITNNTINTDMSVISAQIMYRYSREDR